MPSNTERKPMEDFLDESLEDFEKDCNRESDKSYDLEEENMKENPLRPMKSATYMNKEEQFKDLKSSAVTFLFVSVIGIIFLLLNIVGVLSFFRGIFSYTVLGGLFLCFFYVGVTTLNKSKKVEKEIVGENEKTKVIKEWLSKNVTKSNIDEILGSRANESDEVRFLLIIDHMKEMIQTEFGQFNDDYLDRLVEEYYNDNLEN